MAKLIIGCGYLGLRVADIWLNQHQQVYATTRSALRGKELAAKGIKPIVADVTSPETLSELPEVDSVLYAVGYDRNADKSMREVYVSGLRNVLDSLPDTVNLLTYVSSTGVFGQQEGESVDELSPCRPDREGGRICLEAEEVIRGHAIGSKSIILRLAGIYGPGRIPRQRELLAGEPIPSPAEGAMNLIHVDDAAQIVVQLTETGTPPELFCVSDGQPVLRRDYYTQLAKLLHAPEPRFVEPEEESAVSQRAKSNKRIDNSKLMAALGRELQYPSYREGLAQIVRQGSSSR